jgi:hypothetical protein
MSRTPEEVLADVMLENVDEIVAKSPHPNITHAVIMNDYRRAELAAVIVVAVLTAGDSLASDDTAAWDQILADAVATVRDVP